MACTDFGCLYWLRFRYALCLVGGTAGDRRCLYRSRTTSHAPGNMEVLLIEERSCTGVPGTFDR